MSDKKYDPTVKALAKEAQNYPLESPLKVAKAMGELIVGIPKEKELQDKRICLTPESVGVLVSNGISVRIESGAGDANNYTNRLFSEKGAEIVYDSKSVFECNTILKFNPPSLEELSYMKPGSGLLSALQISQLSNEFLTKLNQKKIISVGFELLEDKGGQKPVVRSLSEIASNCIISIAGEYLSNSISGGMGVVFGGVTGVPPLKMIIIGAGTIGENVCRMARQMGTEVKVFDSQHYKLRRLKKDLGEEVYTSMIDNYTLAKEIQHADVVIGCLRSDEGTSMCVVSEEMIASMKAGSVVIDASISQGGCFETSRITTHENPVYVKHDVIHYCVPNITSRVSKTASRALSYIFTPILLQMNRLGGIEQMTQQKPWFMKGVYSYKGCLTNRNLAEQYNMPFKDLELLFAAGF